MHVPESDDHDYRGTGRTRRLRLHTNSALQSGEMNVTGEEMEQMDEQTLAARMGRTRVFAHVSPEHKVRIVSACKKNGEIVAMTGDLSQ